MQFLLTSRESFFQKKAIPNDRPSLGFLWRKDPTTDGILTTTFCLAEQIRNSRPLIQTNADATELDVLTPATSC